VAISVIVPYAVPANAPTSHVICSPLTLHVPRVLVTELMVNELGRETVAIASEEAAIPAFATTNVAVKLEPTKTWFEDTVEVIDRSTVDVPLKFTDSLPLVISTVADAGVKTKFG